MSADVRFGPCRQNKIQPRIQTIFNRLRGVRNELSIRHEKYKKYLENFWLPVWHCRRIIQSLLFHLYYCTFIVQAAIIKPAFVRHLVQVNLNLNIKATVNLNK